MNIFADHCVPGFLIEILRQNEFRVERAIEAGLHKSSDEKIFDYALANSQILLTLDHDFANILRFNILDSNGVIIFEIEGLSKETIKKRILCFFQNISSKNIRGTLFIVNLNGKISAWPKK